ncbi:MAG: hypothetical protein QM487_07210 [Candidatus Marithrix sp.]
MKALINVESLHETLEQVNERFICFEQIICFLIMELGFEVIKTKFLQALEAEIKLDTTLKLCFGSQPDSIEEIQVIENLKNNINSLRKESGQLLSVDDIFQ